MILHRPERSTPASETEHWSSSATIDSCSWSYSAPEPPTIRSRITLRMTIGSGNNTRRGCTDSPWQTSFSRIARGFQPPSASSPRPYHQLAAVRFYLQFMLGECEHNWIDQVVNEAGGATNHQALLGQIEAWRLQHPEQQICIVTFNYDTMIERTQVAWVGELEACCEHSDAELVPRKTGTDHFGRPSIHPRKAPQRAISRRSHFRSRGRPPSNARSNISMQ